MSNPTPIPPDELARLMACANSCIETMKADGVYRGHRIGVLLLHVSGFSSGYRAGDVVLFRDESPDDTYCIETPMLPDQIRAARERGSLISTVGTMVGVPKRYVRETTGVEMQAAARVAEGKVTA